MKLSITPRQGIEIHVRPLAKRFGDRRKLFYGAPEKSIYQENSAQGDRQENSQKDDNVGPE